MFLSDVDLEAAIESGQLVVNPPPKEFDATSIDLHLDSIDEAKVWDVKSFETHQRELGHEKPFLPIGTFNHKAVGTRYYSPIPSEDDDNLVYRDGKNVVVRPGGFFLWQTQEEVGTPEEEPMLICFIDGKSTKARTGILVHMTAPTIHAGWWGKVVLEISNLGPFRIALKEGDAIAQITVAKITSPPKKKKNAKGVAIGQQDVSGKVPSQSTQQNK